MKNFLPEDHPWKDRIQFFHALPSTNDLAKTLSPEQAPHGTVLLAASQSGGRGRLGRSFHCPAGQGVYMSLILRPNCPPQQLMHLTCAAADAMCDAVYNTCGVMPRIKWINDLVWQGKKLGGILTELVIDPKTGLVSAAIVGIGINCRQQPQDFPEALRPMAASLSMASGSDTDPAALAANMILALYDMDRQLPQKTAMLQRYRQRCVNLGKPVQLLRGGAVRCGTALSVDDQGALVVRFEDGSVEAVSSGEVSVRGMYGYI